MLKWIPWRFAVKYAARANGFVDPIALHSQLQKFSQPAEVAEPVELLRAGVVFHARGLMNSKVIQHNLDWVWPYWVERQCDPEDLSFVPRAFSITQINLTHRNWTAVGYPDCDKLPIVDPRGLLTPFWDGWSLDVWILKKDGSMLLPSRRAVCKQKLKHADGVTVETSFSDNGMALTMRTFVEMTVDGPQCVMESSGSCNDNGWLVVSARPYNPEGISLIDDLTLSSDRCEWTINKKQKVLFDQPADRHHTSNYHDGDVFIHLTEKDDVHAQHCPVGVVTAAAMFKLSAGAEKTLTATVPLKAKSKALGWLKPGRGNQAKNIAVQNSTDAWAQALTTQSQLSIPDEKLSMLYESSVRAMVMCSPDDVYAGPYTYKRFWYRDAVFIGYGLLRAGLTSRAKRIIDRFPDRQRANGYFHSQEGEWDSNGQVLWLIYQYALATNEPINNSLWASVEKGAEWIINKRLPDNGNELWSGLLPAGFSAEHLGPNDYYYWDDYWAIAGLESAANLAEQTGHADMATRYREEAASFSTAVDKTLERWSANNNINAIPASPMRRMDAGAIGSVVTGYPLRLCEADDSALNGTVKFLMENCFCKGGFFQDMIHSGINIYLTLQIAQTLLRKNDVRFYDLVMACSDLATDTGTWPEAVHPHTDGGCMGDGHHTWAAAEWVSIVRNCFVREEADTLVIGSGLVSQWFSGQQALSFGPTPTEFGSVSVAITPVAGMADKCRVDIEADWHHKRPPIIIRLPGYPPVVLPEDRNYVDIEKHSEQAAIA